jgi:outer membrane lipoprotein
MTLSPLRLSILAIPLLSACATAPKPLQGQFTVVSASDVATSGRTGDNIRWGGLVIEVEPEAERTCIQILSRELSDTARPRDRDVSEGRFVACRDGFYDPEIFTRGREVTVAGRVAGLTTRPVGEYAYPMPEVAADVIYLWPERREIDAVYLPYSPWFGWPYYGRWNYGIHYHRSYPGHRAAPPPSRTDKGG